MEVRHPGFAAAAAVLVLAGFAGSASAVIITREPGRMTASPSAALGGTSTSSLEGEWNSFTGTPIASHYFITTSHVGGDAGGTFTVGGQTFKTNAYYDDPNSDLRIYRTDEAFSSFAQLFRKDNEKGRGLVVFGRGAARGDAITINGKRKGWLVNDTSDGALSWGTNRVSKIMPGGAALGDLIVFAFGGGGQPLKGALTEGDAGGGLFIKVGKTWELAGVNYGGDYEFTDPATHTTYQATLYDKGGAYAADGTLIPDVARNVSSAFQATRVSSNTTWIDAVITGSVTPTALPPALGPGIPNPVPEPTAAGVIMGASALLLKRRRRSK